MDEESVSPVHQPDKFEALALQNTFFDLLAAEIGLRPAIDDAAVIESGLLLLRLIERDEIWWF